MLYLVGVNSTKKADATWNILISFGKKMFYVSDSNHRKVIQIYYMRTVALIKRTLPSEPVLDCLSCFDISCS